VTASCKIHGRLNFVKVVGAASSEGLLVMDKSRL